MNMPHIEMIVLLLLLVVPPIIFMLFPLIKRKYTIWAN